MQPKSEMLSKEPLQECPDSCRRSLWSEYFEELWDDTIEETEYSLIRYKILDGVCHVADFFIKDEFRRKQALPTMRDFRNRMREKGVSAITCQVSIDMKGASRRIKLYVKIGFEVFKANSNVLFFVMRL